MRRLLFTLTSVATLLTAAPAAQARVLFDDASTGATTAAATVTMNHLPQWVQVAGASASLYTADTGSQSVAKLSRYAFLRVLGGGIARLQVDAYDDQGNASARGFVDAEDVVPSAPGSDWLVAASDAPLYRSADAGTDVVRTVARFSPLQQTDGPVQGRIEVRAYSSDFKSVVGQGWVDASLTGPAFAPQTRVADPSGTALLRTASVPTQQVFLDTVSSAARVAQAQTGVPASVTVAQAILESDWGRSVLATDANNYFGIKAIGLIGNDGVVWMPTSEYDSAGALYQTTSPFRAYKSLADSLTDHDRLLLISRYAGAMAVANDPRAFAAKLYEAGYSTDPAYPDKLIALMDRYNLYALDA